MEKVARGGEEEGKEGAFSSSLPPLPPAEKSLHFPSTTTTTTTRSPYRSSQRAQTRDTLAAKDDEMNVGRREREREVPFQRLERDPFSFNPSRKGLLLLLFLLAVVGMGERNFFLRKFRLRQISI